MDPLKVSTEPAQKTAVLQSVTLRTPSMMSAQLAPGEKTKKSIYQNDGWPTTLRREDIWIDNGSCFGLVKTSTARSSLRVDKLHPYRYDRRQFRVTALTAFIPTHFTRSFKIN